MKTDSERVAFLRAGRAVETGIIAQAIIEDVAEAFDFRSASEGVQADANQKCLDCVYPSGWLRNRNQSKINSTV